MMSEQEAKKALFNLTLEYMSHKPKERKKLYPKYIEERNKIKKELTKTIFEKKQAELNKSM